MQLKIRRSNYSGIVRNVQNKSSTGNQISADKSYQQTNPESPLSFKPSQIPLAHKIQPKLTINQPGDRYEKEADAIADRIIRMEGCRKASVLGAAPGIQRKCAECEKEEEELQMKKSDQGMANSAQGGISSSFYSQLRDSRGKGNPLPGTIQQSMNHAFGTSLNHVRIHQGSDAESMNRSLNARAFTNGSDIYFNSGEYNPWTLKGKRLLGHELTHVLQQQNRTHQPPTIQCEFAIEPPNPAAAGRVLTAGQMREAIDYNNRVIGAGGADLIREVRDVLGTSREPAVVDEGFVNAVVTWQAMQGLLQDGKLGPRSAAPLFREIGAEGVGECRVQNGATYRPGAPVAVAAGGGAETTHFALSADFESDPANGVFPSCCEVRQFIRWNNASAAAFGATGVPHGGFPAGTPANRFIEDRDAANNRYGHRSGPFSDPQPFDQYLDATGNRNQAFGHQYRGTDDPTVIPAHAVGQWQFYLRVNDVCNRGARVGGDDLIRVNW